MKPDQSRVHMKRGETLFQWRQGVRFVNDDGNAAITQIGFDMDPQSIAQTDREQIRFQSG